ncbi:DEAD/DEAH box helicase [Roseospira goensis]|uniref:ATP-dependent Lhr-like helicase n=1 Tax=Roseospira goensis TaxID=391922 RepID=A0A7W6WM12_9PROT|nr:DEAD/DEAH box helicase [Roseospira goensis]MBB4287625.1 ATP-dependent Lhr-like helicase [Roseospira goensis]
MTSPPSGSEAAAAVPSAGFDRLAEPVRRWIWDQGWRALHDIQDRAIPLILDGDDDLIIAAATAGGKTEAVFLPLLSRIATRDRPGSGFDLVYVGPLKALIDDQFGRLDQLCERLAVPVHRWHGDVSAGAKARARKDPDGILLITPESLEALFVLRGAEIPTLFGATHGIVIDELHALLDVERGIHLRSLLNRLDLALRRPVRRIGLSATLGDMDLARAYLRPADPARVIVLESRAEGQELRLQVRGYAVRVPRDPGSEPAPDADGDPDTDDEEAAADRAIAGHLAKVLRGSRNLVFAGSRQSVEAVADRLRRSCEDAQVPNEFFAHHANLSRDHRGFVEDRLKRGETPATAVCTSTLELGIDIGAVESVAQIGPPFTVASLRQRLGRSGRRAGQPAILRLYIKEKSQDANQHILDALRVGLVQAIAMVDLLIEGWCEPPRPQALHLSTLVHQVLSVIAERGGATARGLFHVLCRTGPFSGVDPATFAAVLRRMGEPDVALIEQVSDGTLLPGKAGERQIEHYGFYAVFRTEAEYRVVRDGQTLGTLPVSFPVVPEMTIIFSGRRWRVLDVDEKTPTILVAPDARGRPPRFGGDASDLHDTVVARMRDVYRRDDHPAYLDPTARRFLSEARATFRRRGLAASSILTEGGDETVLVPWRGTVATETLALALTAVGLPATPWGLAVMVRAPEDKVRAALGALAERAPDPLALAACARTLMREKFHPFLDRPLLERDYASARLTVAAVPDMATALLTGDTRSEDRR